jgi:hypothetical protein
MGNNRESEDHPVGDVEIGNEEEGEEVEEGEEGNVMEIDDIPSSNRVRPEATLVTGDKMEAEIKQQPW